MQRFKPQELANTLWSFASLGHDPSNQLLDTMAIQMVARIQGFRPQVRSACLPAALCTGSHEVRPIVWLAGGPAAMCRLFAYPSFAYPTQVLADGEGDCKHFGFADRHLTR